MATQHHRCARSQSLSQSVPFCASALFLFAVREPMDASAAAVPHPVKRWQLSGTDSDPERVRSLQSRFSAWTPLSDKRRNLQVSKCSRNSVLCSFFDTKTSAAATLRNDDGSVHPSFGASAQMSVKFIQI